MLTVSGINTRDFSSLSDTYLWQPLSTDLLLYLLDPINLCCHLFHSCYFCSGTETKSLSQYIVDFLCSEWVGAVCMLAGRQRSLSGYTGLKIYPIYSVLCWIELFIKFHIQIFMKTYHLIHSLPFLLISFHQVEVNMIAAPSPGPQASRVSTKHVLYIDLSN